MHPAPFAIRPGVRIPRTGASQSMTWLRPARHDRSRRGMVRQFGGKSVWRLLRRIDQCVRERCSLPPLGSQIAADGRPTAAADWPAATSSLMRTSISHPLQIAVVTAGSEFGRIGITFCPGKYDPHALTGAWDRDLNRDLDTIREWGAVAVVTLLEPKELTLLRVEHLGEEILRRNMLWFHLPIADVSTPNKRFEQEWGARSMFACTTTCISDASFSSAVDGGVNKRTTKNGKPVSSASSLPVSVIHAPSQV